MVNTTLLQSFARYMAAIWPFSWVLANRRGRTFELVGVAAFGALFVVFAMLNLTRALAPRPACRQALTGLSSASVVTPNVGDH